MQACVCLAWALHKGLPLSRAPDNAGLTFANILSSCSGDMLNWERLAGGCVRYGAVSTLCERLFGVLIRLSPSAFCGPPV